MFDEFRLALIDSKLPTNDVDDEKYNKPLATVLRLVVFAAKSNSRK